MGSEKSVIENIAKYQYDYNTNLMKIHNMINEEHGKFPSDLYVKYIDLKFIYIYYTKTLFWFRFWNDYGFHAKNYKIHGLTFSERHANKGVKIGNWIFRILRP